MADTSQDRVLTRRNAELFVDPLAAGALIPMGGMYVLDAEGNATPATPDVAGPVRGIALRRADAAAGDVQVEGAQGCYLFENDGSITAGDIFTKDARVVDCHTVGITGTRTAGRIFDVTEEGVFVEIGKRA